MEKKSQLMAATGPSWREIRITAYSLCLERDSNPHLHRPRLRERTGHGGHTIIPSRPRAVRLQSTKPGLTHPDGFLFSFQGPEPVPPPRPALQYHRPPRLIRPVGDELTLVKDVAPALQVPSLAGLGPRLPHHPQPRLPRNPEQGAGLLLPEGLPPGLG